MTFITSAYMLNR